MTPLLVALALAGAPPVARPPARPAAPPAGTPAVAPLSSLAEARALADEFQYEKALKAIDSALLQADLDRESLIALYELAGIAWATLDKPNKARDAFTLLLLVAPEHQLSKNLPPRTRTPYFEAKSNAAKLGALALTAEPVVREGGHIGQLTVTAKDNSLIAAKAVRFTLKVDDLEPRVQVVKLDANKQAAVLANGTVVSWTAELLGERNAVLVKLSREERPLAAVVSPPPPPPQMVVAAAPSSGGWARPTGFVVGALGLAGLAAGGVFGYLSADARGKVANAQKDASGVVVELTQREAAALDATARTDAVIANAAFIGGGVLAAAGVVFLIVGSQADAPPPVAFSVSPAGISVSGRF
jgi:hypothetical protein